MAASQLQNVSLLSNYSRHFNENNLYYFFTLLDHQLHLVKPTLNSICQDGCEKKRME
jgi:hypothetical protein